MIIEFSFSNFRSIKERQTLSLVANNSLVTQDKKKLLPENLIELNAPGLPDVKLLKSAVIYGANASGKSNVIKAIDFMQDFVMKSFTGLKPEEEIGIPFFAFDSISHEIPSEFEAIFINNGVRYQYGFVLDKWKVHEEWLYAYPKGRTQRWFHRMFNVKKERYDWKFSKEHFKGDKNGIKIGTRHNALFLSTGAQLNNGQLKSIYEWFRNNIRFLDYSSSNVERGIGLSAGIMLEDPDIADKVKKFMRHVDFGIDDISISKKEFSEKDIKSSSPVIEALLKEDPEFFKDKKFIDIKWLHKNVNTIALTSVDESTGSLKCFSLLAPWIDTLINGYTVFIDEIGANMHPILLRNLFKMMNDSAINKSGAQIVITTHDVTLLDTELFRRDQIWFTEKNAQGETELYPLTDYSPRSGEALQKGYLAGRYGAIPLIRGDLKLDGNKR
ncbi:MAG: ATP-binding protein [Sedimentisphaerales bacterium]|nr:ATP-binding protein [Sedimentisphaerales bacterium]